ncbi:MAG: type 4a pilus biogenesis protein PilO [Phycisphaerae bacterium]|jgi:Tfp pilus assembly protein PilO
MNEATTTRGQRTMPAHAVHAVGGAGALALGAVFFVLVLAPMQARYAKAQQDASKLTTASDALAATDDKIDSARKQVDALQKQLGESVQLQPASSVNRVVQQVTDVAVAAGLEVAEVKPGERTAGSAREFAVVPIQLVASGTFAQALTFLEQSNQQFRDIATRGISLQRVDGEQGKVRVALELAWHTLPAESAGGNGRNESAGAR